MWRHASTGDAINVHPMQDRCIFCEERMFVEEMEDRWRFDRNEIKKEHEMQIDSQSEYIEDTYREHRKITSDIEPVGVNFHCCPACGWWCIVQIIEYSTPRMPYMAFQWAAGVLIQENIAEISGPLSEVRSYLCACYNQRFLIDSFMLEGVVASIFRSFQCRVEVSSRSGDGGIDVFGVDSLERPFGIQVKRYRKRIRVEQIRSFIGALVLQSLPRGVFVTTSDFTAGVSALCRKAKLAGIQLEAVDAAKLYEMLKVVQIRDFDRSMINELALTYAQLVPELNYGYARHLGSL